MRTTGLIIIGIFLGAGILASCEGIKIRTGDPNIDRALGIGESSLKAGSAIAKAAEDFTPEQEYYIGRAVAANLIAKYGVYEDPKATAYVNKVGQAVAAFSTKPEVYKGYRFVILNSDEVNGFAAPGSFIFVTKGLLRTCDSEDELAAVLAHEVAHIEHNHPIMAIKQARGTEAFLVILGEAAKQSGERDVAQLTNAYGDMVSDVIEKVSVSGYSREQEAEADGAAVQTLTQSGYNAAALIHVLEHMDKKLRPGGLDFAKTHPKPNDRIKSIKAQAKDTGDGPAVRQSRFTTALVGIRG